MTRFFEPVTLTEQVSRSPLLIYAALSFSLAATYLALWRAATDFRIFRNMGVFLLLVGAEEVTLYLGGDSFQWALIALISPVIVTIAGEAMRIPNRRWSMLIWPVCLGQLIFGWFPSFQGLRLHTIDISNFLLCILTIEGIRLGRRRDRQIAAAFVFLICFRWTLSPLFRAVTGLPRSVDLKGWHWSLNPISLILLATTTLAVYVRALVEDRREKQRLVAELEAARSVQQVLIPDDVSSVAGFAIDTVYKPAGEVGGDFFQVLPLSDKRVLIVIGDVSGKGMPAAMIVSLLIGTLRTLVHYTQSPAEILAAMNQRVLNRSRGGFTTCLIVRADPDGILTLANAGHLSPYKSGRETEVEACLPLGLDDHAVYAETSIELGQGQQLTLVTDGVVEARGKGGELFGFDRTEAISSQGAEAIAEAAQTFGQDDDITVLTVTRLATV